MDYRDLDPQHRVSAVERRAEKDPRDWWSYEGAEAAESVTSVLMDMREPMRARVTSLIAFAQMYGGGMARAFGFGGTFAAYAAKVPSMQDRLRDNVTQSGGDTLCARIGKSRPRPYYLTSGGNFHEQRRAQKLNRFVDGVFYENKAHELGRRILKDAFVWGDGFCHVFIRDNRIAYERVLPHELYVDDSEQLGDDLRQMHRVKDVNVDVLCAMFPDHAAAIELAAKSDGSYRATATNVSDRVLLRESWHLRSSEDAKDGRHVLSVEGCILSEEGWELDCFPIVRLPWLRRQFGYFSQGGVEQVQSLQLELNELLWTMQRSFRLMGVPRVLLHASSKIVKQHLNNDVGAALNWTGEHKPEFVVSPSVHPDYFGWVNAIRQEILGRLGLTQNQSTGAKPPGVTSGVALREIDQIETDRSSPQSMAYEEFFVDLANVSLKLLSKHIGRKSYKVRSAGARYVEVLDWRDVQMDTASLVMKCFPVSSLPTDPAGRLQTIQEYIEAGFMTPRQGRRALDFPDLESYESLANAAEDNACRMLDGIVDDGEMSIPEVFDDLVMLREMALQMYQQGRASGLDEDRLQMLRVFLQHVQMLMMPPANDAPALSPSAGGGAPMPLAPPNPRPPSDLVPNVPQLAAA